MRSVLSVLTVVVVSVVPMAYGQSQAPPLPLHGIEGYGGVFSTYSAYLVNPPVDGRVIGLPAGEVAYVWLNHGRYLMAGTVTENLFGRLELGYGWNELHLGDLAEDIHAATGVTISRNTVTVDNLNARLAVLEEGAFEQKWIPALTVGAHFKSNSGVEAINDDLGGVLTAIGIVETEGWDYTAYLSKMIPMSHPLLVNLGLRSSEAAHLGLLGFTGERNLLFEGNLVWFVASNVALAGEYRQKPSEYQPIPGLVGEEDDWFTLDVCVVASSHLTLAAGYGHFGQVLNHEANRAWGVKAKWEF